MDNATVLVVCGQHEHFEYFIRHLKPEFRPYRHLFKRVTSVLDLRAYRDLEILTTGPDRYPYNMGPDYIEIVDTAKAAGHRWVSQWTYMADEIEAVADG